MLSQIKRAIDEDTMLISALYTFMDRSVHIKCTWLYICTYVHTHSTERKEKGGPCTHIHIQSRGKTSFIVLKGL